MTDPEMKDLMNNTMSRTLDLNMVAIMSGDLWDIYTLQPDDTWKLSMTSMEISKLEA